jgi:ABC-2 type transport system ATP-binding protein
MKKLGKKQLTLDLAQPLATLPDALAGRSIELSADGNRLVYTFQAQDEAGGGIAGLLDQLEKLGIVFKDLQTRQSSLEDIFVSLVKGAA